MPFYDKAGHFIAFTPLWSAPEPIGSPMFCSPLLGKDSATDRYHAFIGADDGKVHVFQARQTPEGERRVNTLTDGGRPLNGPIRSSMAAFNGRLFVLSAGETDSTGAFTKAPRLYGFGQ